MEVYDPTGMVQTTEDYAPRLPDLNGKTICELSDYIWESKRIFPAIRERLKERFPGAKIIPYTEFPTTMRFEPESLLKMIREKGCDAAIIGNAA
jgi:hypothetical protein